MRGETRQSSDDQLPTLLTLAHELKSPLALIRQLGSARAYYDAEETLAALRRIELTAERSLRLVEMLTRSHWASELACEPLNLNKLCEEVAHELSPLVKYNQQSLQLQLPSTALLAVGNRELVSSVVFGLCDNALAPRGVREPVVLKVARVKSHIRVGVDDHNSSLTSTAAARVGRRPLEPAALRPGSSGLGLYIASQFAVAMKGKIGFLKHHRGGHFFYLDMPRSTQLSLL